MMIEFTAVPMLDARKKNLRVELSKTATEPGTSQNSNEEDVHITRMTQDLWRIPGCSLLSTPAPEKTSPERFYSGSTKHYGRPLIDQAKCWKQSAFTANCSPGCPRPVSWFDCDLALGSVRLAAVYDELIAGGTQRARKPFSGLKWLPNIP
jgi:hypothetical protein